jgi:hypothetical protein
LLDVVDTTLEPAGGVGRGVADSPVLTRHPLHAYDERNFDVAGVSATNRIFSFDDVMCQAAETSRHRADDTAAATWRRYDLARPITPVVDLRQLVDACVRPAHILLRDGLDVVVPGEVDRPDHEIPLGVSKLAASGLGRRLLERYWRDAAALSPSATAEQWEVAARTALDDWAIAERLGGAAPPGKLIDGTLDDIAADIDVITAAAQCCGLDRARVLAASEVIDVDVELTVTGEFTSRREGVPDRLRLVDSVRRISDGVIYRLGYRRPKAGFLVTAAVDLAAVVLVTGDGGWRAVTATRGAQGSGTAECHLFEVIAADPRAAARALLETAAELRVAALAGAVPVFETTTRTLYDKGFIDEDEFVGNDYRMGDLTDVSNHFVWGDISVGEVTTLSPSPKALADRIWGAIHALVSLEPVDDKVASE